MADCQELPKVTRLNKIWCFNCLEHPVSLNYHLGMAVENVLPALRRQANRHATDRVDAHGVTDGVTSVVQSSTTTWYGRSAFGVTS